MAAAPSTCMGESLGHLRQVPEAHDKSKPESKPHSPGLLSPTLSFSPGAGSSERQWATPNRPCLGFLGQP